MNKNNGVSQSDIYLDVILLTYLSTPYGKSVSDKICLGLITFTYVTENINN